MHPNLPPAHCQWIARLDLHMANRLELFTEGRFADLSTQEKADAYYAQNGVDIAYAIRKQVTDGCGSVGMDPKWFAQRSFDRREFYFGLRGPWWPPFCQLVSQRTALPDCVYQVASNVMFGTAGFQPTGWQRASSQSAAAGEAALARVAAACVASDKPAFLKALAAERAVDQEANFVDAVITVRSRMRGSQSIAAASASEAATAAPEAARAATAPQGATSKASARCRATRGTAPIQAKAPSPATAFNQRTGPTENPENGPK